MLKRNRDVLVAEYVMGYQCNDGVWWEDSERVLYRIGDLSFSTDHVAAFEMEAEIERRGMRHEYIKQLMHVLNTYYQTFDDDYWWRIIHATPSQRVEAALCAFGVNPDAET